MDLATSFQTDQKPVILVDLQFDSGTVSIWTRPFTGPHNGVTYRPISGLTSSISVKQSLDQTSLEASARISGTANEILAAALTENFQCRQATISLGNIGSDGSIDASEVILQGVMQDIPCLLYTSPSPRDQRGSRMPSSA